MVSDQPNEPSGVLAVVHLIVADMPNKSAYGCTDENGTQVVYADRRAIEGDPEARENAYKVVTDAVITAMAATAMKLAPVI